MDYIDPFGLSTPASSPAEPPPGLHTLLNYGTAKPFRSPVRPESTIRVMAKIFSLLCVLSVITLTSSMPVQDMTNRGMSTDGEFIRSTLSSWDTALPTRETDEEVEPTPQEDLK
ncbi:hypothetical protein MMC14_004425 [Varicellaria rhodocarpa]|nr:hypothetical protein [Varicellaria rhodocarpa]